VLYVWEWLLVDNDSAFGSLDCVSAGSVARVSEVQAIPIFAHSPYSFRLWTWRQHVSLKRMQHCRYPHGDTNQDNNENQQCISVPAYVRLAAFWAMIYIERPPPEKLYTHFNRSLWSSGQSSWLQIQRSRVRFLWSSGSGTGSTQPCEDNWGATWMEK
jgi:hypothetical protein